MSILSFTRAWPALEEQTTIHVVLPNQIDPKNKLQVLWLLHGLGDKKDEFGSFNQVYESGSHYPRNESQLLYEYG